MLTESFYWDLNDRTRALTQRVRSRLTDNQVPNMVTAGNYSAVLHYLKAVADMGVAAAKASGIEAINRMKAMPCDDDAFGQGTHPSRTAASCCPAYLFEVKQPSEIARRLGLLQAPADHAGRRGVPPDERGRLPAGA